MFGDFSDFQDLTQNLARPARDFLADGGEKDARIAAFHQLRAKAYFKVAQLRAEGRLADIRAFGRAPEMQMVGDGHEVLKLLQADHGGFPLWLRGSGKASTAANHASEATASMIEKIYQ